MPSMPLTPRHAAAITAVLGMLSLFPPLATDMYLAAMGDLAASMKASHSAAELSLSIFFLGLCIGQLVMGPLSDGYGRKVPLLLGTAVFTATSIALPLIGDITLFNMVRFVQAIGASAGMVVGRAVVRDLYDGQRAAKVMTVLVMLLTIGPIVSPTLGSLLLEVFGWRAIFYTMALVSVVALVASQLILPETLAVSKRASHPFRMGASTAGTLLSRRAFLVPALTAGLVQAGMFAFITGSSGVFQGVFGLSSLQYGLVFALVAAALVVFGRVNTRLLDHFTLGQIIRFVLPAHVAATLVLTLLSDVSSIWLFIAPLWLAIGLVGLLSANAMSIAMGAAREGAGIGSALLGAIQFGIAFSVSSCVALGGSDTPLPMALGLLLPSVLATVLWMAARRREPVDDVLVDGV